MQSQGVFAIRSSKTPVSGPAAKRGLKMLLASFIFKALTGLLLIFTGNGGSCMSQTYDHSVSVRACNHGGDTPRHLTALLMQLRGCRVKCTTCTQMHLITPVHVQVWTEACHLDLPYKVVHGCLLVFKESR